MAASPLPRRLGIFVKSIERTNPLLSYGTAVVATLCSLALSLSLRPATYQTPYLPFYGAVLAAVMFGGMKSGLLATLLSALSVHYYFLPPYNSFAITPKSALQGTYFCLTFGAICWLIARRATRSEAEIKAREDDLRRAQSVASTGSWRLDVVRNELLWSDETYRIFGLPLGIPLTYEKFIACVHPDDRELVQRQWKAALSGEPYDIEHRVVVGSHVKWVRETAQLEFKPNGELRGGFGAVQDITKRKTAELALMESESRLRTVLQTLPVGVWLTNSKGDIVFGNPAAQRIWGGARYVGVERYGEYKGWWYETGQRIAPEEWALARALRGETSLNEQVEIECFDGTRKIIYNSGIPITDDGGTLLGALVINEDITERKKSEEALMRTEKLASAGRLAATIAHEINNPLEAVTNVLYLAQLQTDLSPELKQLLDIASQEISRVSHITRTTLGFYRDTVAPGQVDIKALFDEILVLYERKLSSKKVTIERRFADSVKVYGNAGELRQVLSNLVANAIDALSNDGRLVVGATRSCVFERGETITLTVADTGDGIAPSDVNRIFEAFYTTKESVGTGLGLWLSRQIVEKHGGAIRVRSRVGTGTVFRVTLPAKPLAARATA